MLVVRDFPVHVYVCTYMWAYDHLRYYLHGTSFMRTFNQLK